jgi:lycopene cyclase domain-containing protein
VIPEYTLAGLAWLGGSLVLAGAAGILRRRSAWIAFGVFLGFTVVFDAVLTGLPIVVYGDEHILGIRLGTTPIEDYLYGQALCLTAIATYEIARRRLRSTARRPALPVRPSEPAAPSAPPAP